jgi:AraC family transcriptional regulator
MHMQPHKLSRVLAFIEEHLAERIEATDLAATIHMSRFHFSRKFKAATGLAPYDFVTMRRMEVSKALLAGTELPVVEVALRSGYRTHAHFTGMFHRRVGTTPSAFRRANKVALIHPHTHHPEAVVMPRLEAVVASPSAQA